MRLLATLARTPRGIVIAAMIPLGACTGGVEQPPAATTPRSWQVVELPTAAEFHGIQFLDEERGFIVGGGHLVTGGILGRTTDGGETWELHSGYVPSDKISFALYDAWFLDDRRGFLAGYGGVLLTTNDGWKAFSRQRFGAGPSSHLRDIYFVDERYGWVLGEEGLLSTVDGGETWRWAKRSNARDGYFSARVIRFVDNRRGFLAGKFGKLQRTLDAGRSWEDATTIPDWPDPAPDLFGLTFVDTKTGWAVGENGTIVHTRDGGDSWVEQSSGVRDFLMDVAFVTDQRGWAVGFDRGLRRSVVLGTINGGATWSVEVEVPDEELRTVCALAPGYVWAAGKHVGQGPQKLLRRVPGD